MASSRDHVPFDRAFMKWILRIDVELLEIVSMDD